MSLNNCNLLSARQKYCRKFCFVVRNESMMQDIQGFATCGSRYIAEIQKSFSLHHVYDCFKNFQTSDFKDLWFKDLWFLFILISDLVSSLKRLLYSCVLAIYLPNMLCNW